MALGTGEVEADLIEAVCERVRDKLPAEAAGPAEEFVRQYYRWVPAEDLAERSALDLYGAAVAHWNLLQHRVGSEPKVHVYNPVFDRNGWQSPHTVVEVITDDMPFLVDSVTMQLGHGGNEIKLVIHPVIRVRRDANGYLQDIVPHGAPDEEAIAESILHVEVEREADPALMGYIRDRVERVLTEVRATVEDWGPMRERARQLAAELAATPDETGARDLAETGEFLRWLADDHFTFLGYREYVIDRGRRPIGLEALPDTGLGILRGTPHTPFKALGERTASLIDDPRALVLTKANSRSTVHRPSYLDYIGVKRFDDDGRVVGEYRFLGLYTTDAYREHAREVPTLRGKLRYVLDRAGFPPDSHDAKALTEIIESYPRDSLFQITSEELFEVAIGILGVGERQLVRLFVRRDPLDRYVACLVLIPRDRFNTDTRERIAAILIEAFGGTHADWTVLLAESLNARVHYIVHGGRGGRAVDLAEVQVRLVSATRAWTDDLRDALTESLGEERGGAVHRHFENAFPPAYRDDWVARSAVADIARIDELYTRGGEPIINLYRPLETPEGILRCKLYSAVEVSLSDVLPTFEHMGACVVDERPYVVTPADSPGVWIYDFGLRCMTDDLEHARGRFEDAFLSVRRGELEDDGLNALVLGAELTGRQITVIRAIAKYLRQAGIPFSDSYMQRTLIAHPEIVILLVRLFIARLDPDQVDLELAEQLAVQIGHAIDAVRSLDEDRILRSFLSVVRAILRTNQFCRDAQGEPRGYLSFKLDPEQVPILPLPRPRFEIFVYSPRVEGVHLRGGTVARGGLRWSDRREDFRTEVLGLMKAQMVKNALIVPVGSKGGFVVKRPPADASREAQLAEGIACYRTFLSGLLDLTDNIVSGEVVPPEGVVRYDGDDPYLVVAADKGTATFSDIANAVSADYGFWLGDAFASGGSQGYDHKAMGITARGAWESVKRHFRELGTDIQQTPFTIVGIGDMSGDVFGNGMLLSPQIKLLAAFNHMHVFLDPDPDPEVSFAERRRLFALERSGWGDYNPSLISPGGGVYPRTAKSITLSPEAKQALGIELDECSPTALIKELLKAPVDLLWNGGIGTYVKASGETQADVGDKANDAVRVDGRELRCRVVGEGGNLGFTQRGRIEYAEGGGLINTDAIDNVAGVNCSDHEVNIKILLGALLADGDLTEKQRGALLRAMTDSVAERVLHGSYKQTQAMSLAMAQSASMVDVHQRMIRRLEQVAGLHRELEFLPSDDVLAERRQAHRGLLAPELAVIMAYCKIRLYTELLDSDVPEDRYLEHADLERYFPSPLPERYGPEMRAHRLRREIIATVVANQLVDRAGTTFVFRLEEETGASAASLARAFAVARDVYRMRDLWEQVEALDNVVPAKVQISMLIDARRLVERATRWLVRSNPGTIDIAFTTRYFADGARTLAQALPDVLSGTDRDSFDARAAELTDAGVPEPLARRAAGLEPMLAVFDLVEVADALGREPQAVMESYFELGSRLQLDWLGDRIIELPRANRWQALARAALRDDLNNLRRVLSQEVLELAGPGVGSHAAIEAWMAHHDVAVDRCLKMLAEIRAARAYDTTTLPVALREVRNLIRSAPQGGVVASAASITMAG
ncbi:MAG TPA: NAD-glutamate dehydrogenase [Solirubrobacteraceae bacterium]|nr:NAD-glutamate dehydrogenase [Solirubrobacteraceae bacterium]